MRKISIVTLLALVVGSAPMVLAEHHGAGHLKYVELNKIGDPAQVLVVKHQKTQALQSGEVRIRILAAPIHPSNLLQIAGNYGVDAVLPSTPGSEGVGRVLEVTPQVKHLSVGQLVLLAGVGTWRDELVAPAAALIPLPDLGSPSDQVIEQLSMTTVNPLSALLMLDLYTDLKKGDWVVQSAANSAVGGYLIQLAKQRGIKTVNVVRREGLAEDLMAKGGDVVLIDGPNLAKKIAAATGNAPIVLAVDAVGGETFTRLAQSMGDGGTLVTYGALSGKPAVVSQGVLIGKDIRIRGFWLSKWFLTVSAAERQAAYAKVIPLIVSGALQANVDSRFSVADIKQAVTRAAERGRNGKVIIVPSVD